MRYLLIITFIIFALLACAGSEQIKEKTEIRGGTGTGAPAVASDTPEEIPPASIISEKNVPDEISLPPAVPEALDNDAMEKAMELKQHLVRNGVPGQWFDQQLRHDHFRVHPGVNNYFRKSAERQVDHDKTHDASWYFARMRVDAKIEKGKIFIAANKDIFRRAEAKHGIHAELIAAIIGIETNFGDQLHHGNFYAFNSLVSQYIFTKRKKFAVREITALYKFSQMTGRQPHYFTSSYAGAIGWGQFMPSSLLAFFIDANGVHADTDPFSLEDTVFSVENYLYKHNLSVKNISDANARYKAVYAYNHSDVYVKAVLLIYDGLRNNLQKTYR